MTRLAHISDVHVLDLAGVPWTRFLNKRLTGVANLMGARRGAHPTERFQALVADLHESLRAGDIDHVACTGDVTNLALESEFLRVRELLEPIADPCTLSAIPGNHDVYTAGSHRTNRFEQFFGDLLWDGEMPTPGQRYPWAKRVGDVQLFGLCSAVPTAPLLATGVVDGGQLTRLERRLAALAAPRPFTVVMVHHNLHERSWRKNLLHGLKNRAEVLDRCERAGVDLLLHGHTHVANRFQHGRMHVVGCGSSTWSSEHPEHAARYNVYEIEGRHLRATEVRIWDRETGRFQPQVHASA